ncbi:MAG: hypothetical protein HQM02_05430 [Magnetococcales bacterium]|nr:hypothetical protein [Magnetococcales bacterium]
MIAKSSAIKTSWVDPDDAPELTGEEMDRPDAVWAIGGQQVTPEEGKTAFRKLLNMDHATNSRKQGSNTERFGAESAIAFPA